MGHMEEQNRAYELSAATMSSRLSELTALQQAAEYDAQQQRQRNDRLNDQLTQLQRQVSDDDEDDDDIIILGLELELYHLTPHISVLITVLSVCHYFVHL